MKADVWWPVTDGNERDRWENSLYLRAPQKGTWVVWIRCGLGMVIDDGFIGLDFGLVVVLISCLGLDGGADFVFDACEICVECWFVVVFGWLGRSLKTSGSSPPDHLLLRCTFLLQ
ncbi:hypothetical protein Q3G72_007102 [Acer saccharum]|nr:hypothetical protein Q3G72_007102 [Acer saccharum]